jgi:hypothetical protein
MQQFSPTHFLLGIALFILPFPIFHEMEWFFSKIQCRVPEINCINIPLLIHDAFEECWAQ